MVLVVVNYQTIVKMVYMTISLSTIIGDDEHVVAQFDFVPKYIILISTVL